MNEYIPVENDCSSISQLPDAGALSAGSLFVVSQPDESLDTGYRSAKLTYSGLVGAVSASMSADRMSSMVETLSGLMGGGYQICCNVRHPYVISSLYEEHGQIISAGGYYLSGYVDAILCDLVKVEQKYRPEPGEETEVLAVISAGSTKAEIIAPAGAAGASQVVFRKWED